MDGKDHGAGGKRLYHLDAVKAVAILFVLYDHAPLLPIGSVGGNVSILIAELAPALFFLVSGAELLTRDVPPGRFFWRIVKAYLGVVFWKLVYFLLAPWVFPVPAQIWNIGKGDFLTYLFFFGQIEGIETGHFWFTHAYLSILLLSPFLRAFLQASFVSAMDGMDKMWKRAYHVLPLLLSYFLGTFPFSLRLLTGKNGTFLTELNPFGAYSYLFFFFALGGYLYHEGMDGIKRPLFALFLLLLGLSVQLWAYHAVFSSFGWQGQNLPGHSYMSSAIPIAVGTFLLLREGFCALERTGKARSFPARLLQLVGRHTLGIYYLHMLPMAAVCRLLSPHLGIGVNLLKTLLLLLPCLLCSILLRKLYTIRTQDSPYPFRR